MAERHYRDVKDRPAKDLVCYWQCTFRSFDPEPPVVNHDEWVRRGRPGAASNPKLSIRFTLTEPELFAIADLLEIHYQGSSYLWVEWWEPADG